MGKREKQKCGETVTARATVTTSTWWGRPTGEKKTGITVGLRGCSAVLEPCATGTLLVKLFDGEVCLTNRWLHAEVSAGSLKLLESSDSVGTVYFSAGREKITGGFVMLLAGTDRVHVNFMQRKKS